MAAVQRVGDRNSGGGVTTSGDGSVLINGLPVSVSGGPVGWHGKRQHAGSVATGGRSSVQVGNKSVICAGDMDACGHSHVGGSSDVVAGDNTEVGALTVLELTLAPITAEAKQFINDDLDDGTPEGAAKADNYVRESVKNGSFNQTAIDRGNSLQPQAVDNTKTETRPPTPVDCAAVSQGFNLSTLIGTSTTLGNFIRDYPALPNCKLNSVPAQCGLQPSEIVCNLSHLCTNIWEPLKAKYPNAIITNSLRTGSNVGAGPHGTGQSMDVQFSGLQPVDYFAVAQWVKGNLPYNQLILEYHTARGPLVAWLHIGIYAGTGQQVSGVNQLLTMMNHRIKNTGLANLAG